MKIVERIRNYLRLISIKRNDAIYTCIQNNIPLTDENIKEVVEILKQKATKEFSKNKIQQSCEHQTPQLNQLIIKTIN